MNSVTVRLSAAARDFNARFCFTVQRIWVKTSLVSDGFFFGRPRAFFFAIFYSVVTKIRCDFSIVCNNRSDGFYGT